MALINGQEMKFYAVPVLYGNMDTEGYSEYMYEVCPPVPVEKATWEKYPGKTFFDTEEEALIWGAKQIIPNLKRIENPKVKILCRTPSQL